MSQANALFPPIDATVEQENFTFDFGFLLSSGASISSVNQIVCKVAANSADVDANPSSRIIGGSSVVNAPAPPAGSGVVNGAVVQQFGNMVGGVIYVLECVVNTSDGQVLSLWSYLQCATPQ